MATKKAKTEKAAPKAAKPKAEKPAKKAVSAGTALSPPADPVKPAVPESGKKAPLDKAKAEVLEQTMAKVKAGLIEIKEAVNGVFPEARSTRWIEKRIAGLEKEVQRHLDKAARRA